MTYIHILPYYMHNSPQWWQNFTNGMDPATDDNILEYGKPYIIGTSLDEDTHYCHVEFDSEESYIHFVLKYS